MDKKTGVRDPDEKVVEIEMERLRAFPNHPFKVIGDSQMIELQDSIKKYGVLNGMNIRSCIRKSAGCLRSLIWKKTISVCRMQRIFLESQKKSCQSLPGRAGLGSILKSACLRIKSGSPKRASNTF